MKKKILSILLMVAVTFVFMTGCSKKVEESEKPQEVAEESEPEEETAEVLPEEEEEETLQEEKAPQVMVVSTYEEATTDDGSKSLVSYNTESVILSEECASDFPELDAALKAEMEAREEEAKKGLNEDASYAKEAYAQTSDGFEYGPWETTRDISVTRADSEVLSFTSFYSGYAGGAHGMYSTGGYNYEVKSGKAITVDMAFSDKEKLGQIVWDGLCDQYPDLVEDFNSSDAKTTIQQYTNGEYEYQYTLDPCSVSFYFSPYTFASYAAGAQTVTFTYDELKEVINEAYVPDKSEPVMSGGDVFDIDSDGDIEAIATFIEYPDGDEGYGRIKVTIDETEYMLTTEVLGYETTNYIARTEGGKVFLLVSASVENDYSVTTICDVSDGKVTEVGTTWLDHWGRPLDDKYTRYATYCWTDPTALPMAERLNLMSTYDGEKTYRLTDEGKLMSEDEYFMVPVSYMPLHTKREFQADVIDEEGNVIEKDFTVPSGSDIIIYRTDGVTDEDSEAIIDVWLDKEGGKLLRLSYSNDYPRKVNGIDENELYESLYYAG